MRIDDWRARIDKIDDEIVVLLNLRICLVAEIVAEKLQNKLPLRDLQREDEILLRARQCNPGPMDDRWSGSCQGSIAARRMVEKRCGGRTARIDMGNNEAWASLSGMSQVLVYSAFIGQQP
jgi:chorismate mutase